MAKQLHPMAWVSRQNTGLTASEKLVLFCIASHADMNGGNCFPTINMLAKESFQSERNVRRMIQSLEGKGLIKTTRGRYGLFFTLQLDVFLSSDRTNATLQIGHGVRADRTNTTSPINKEQPTEQLTEQPTSSFSSAIASEKEGGNAQTRDPHPKPESTAAKKVQDSRKPAPKKQNPDTRILTIADKPDDATAETWAEALAYRHSIRKPARVSTLKHWQREVAKVPGLTLEDALSTMIASGWQGFNASYFPQSRIKVLTSPARGAPSHTRTENLNAKLDAAFGDPYDILGIPKPDTTDTGRTIEGEIDHGNANRPFEYAA